ncbi:MAG: HAD-IA family hydrolase [Pseudomonadota bacterium]
MARHLVIFDCDGTLVDSQHLIVAAMEQAFNAANQPSPPRDAILGIVGLSLPEAIWRLTSGAEEATVLKISDGYKNAFGELRKDPNHWEPMYDGAHACVTALAADDRFVLGIATGKSQRGVARVLERFELVGHFETIQTADDAPSKPHPGMIERALEETGAEKAHTVMIGDTTFDMEMARNAGVTGIGVSWGYHPHEHLDGDGVHEIAHDYPQLMLLLQARLGMQATEQIP